MLCLSLTADEARECGRTKMQRRWTHESVTLLSNWNSLSSSHAILVTTLENHHFSLHLPSPTFSRFNVSLCGPRFALSVAPDYTWNASSHWAAVTTDRHRRAAAAAASPPPVTWPQTCLPRHCRPAISAACDAPSTLHPLSTSATPQHLCSSPSAPPPPTEHTERETAGDDPPR